MSIKYQSSCSVEVSLGPSAALLDTFQTRQASLVFVFAHDHDGDSDGEEQNDDRYRNDNSGCIVGVRALFGGGAAVQAIFSYDCAVLKLAQFARGLKLLAF